MCEGENNMKTMMKLNQTSDNEPGGIENATTIHWNVEAINIRLFLLMYCGLHFLFRQAHYHS
jgi:hypothetical protein